MSELSKQYHSINIGEFNTWDSWHLVPSSRPLVNPPEVATEYVEIPGADGSLDYTEVLSGKPVYRDRKGSWEFIVMNGYQEWHQLYDLLLSTIHGKKFTVSLDDAPEYEYTGRITLNEWRSEEHNSTITIDYVLAPFKKLASGTVSDWKWDDLTFDSGAYIIYYGTFDVSGTKERTIYNPGSDSVELSLTLTDTMEVTINGKTRTYPSGLFEHSGFILGPGSNAATFTGNGRVTLNYDKGEII